MTFNGSITCNNLTAKNSGNIAGWTIHSDKLSAGSRTSELRGDGSAYFYPEAGGTLIINNGFRVNAPGGVLIASTGDYTTMPGEGNLRLQSPYNINIHAGQYARLSAASGVRLRGAGLSIGNEDDTNTWNGASGYMKVDTKLDGTDLWIACEKGIITYMGTSESSASSHTSGSRKD